MREREREGEKEISMGWRESENGVVDLRGKFDKHYKIFIRNGRQSGFC